LSGPWLFLLHSLKRTRMLVLSMGAVLGAFQLVLVLVARSIQGAGGFEQITNMLPSFARELMGPSLTSFMSFAGIVCLGYFHLSVMGSLVALSIALATVPASEVESGFIDLILSRPLARHWIITRTIVATVLCLTLVLCFMMAGTWAGLHALAPSNVKWPSAQLVGSLALNLGLLMLCWAGVAAAIASASRRRGVAGALAGLLALTTFLLDYVGRLWQVAEKVAWLSPFRYFNPFDLVMGNPLSGKNLAVLGGISAVGFATAYVLFARRDISH
jgi:ABC-2 type transport system permease protein